MWEISGRLRSLSLKIETSRADLDFKTNSQFEDLFATAFTQSINKQN